MTLSLAPFVGNAEYCYANSASMLLASIGEEIEAGLIESITAVGSGARLWRHDGMIYFSILPPDIGLTRAFRALGFDVQEQAFGSDSAFPAEKLEAEVGRGPVLIGPLDMEYLTYLPGHESLGGIDHYVLVTAFEAPGRVRLHDPKGYPNVSLTFKDLKAAWRAAGISYARGAFRFWSCPKRVESVNRAELVKRCIDAYRAAYAWETEVPSDRLIVGRAAFEAAARNLTQENSDGLANMLIYFGFPVGARRAHDLAVLLEDEAAGLAAAKRDQALAFVDGFRHLVDGDRTGAGNAIMQIAEHDEQFRNRLSN